MHHGLLNVDRILVDGLAGRVLKEHEALDAAFAFEEHVTGGALVGELDVHAGIEERELAQAIQERVIVEFDHGLEDVRVGQKVHFGAALGGRPGGFMGLTATIWPVCGSACISVMRSMTAP